MANDKGKAAVVSKGVYGKGVYGKGIRKNESQNRKRKDRGVLQFFEDAADVDYHDDEEEEEEESDESVFDDDGNIEDRFFQLFCNLFILRFFMLCACVFCPFY